MNIKLHKKVVSKFDYSENLFTENMNIFLLLQGSTKCRARVVTNIIDGVQKIVLSSFEHNHPIYMKRKSRTRVTELPKVP